MASAESVAAVIEAGGAHVPELMERLEARLAELARSHGAVLAEHAGTTIAAGGKRLRPLLVFVAAGPEPRDADLVLRAAVAVELVHSATLVHDDVLDAAPLRRGLPTVVATSGRSRAVATGDLLFSRAFAELALAEDGEQDPGAGRQIDLLARASVALARGELGERAREQQVADGGGPLGPRGLEHGRPAGPRLCRRRWRNRAPRKGIPPGHSGRGCRQAGARRAAA